MALYRYELAAPIHAAGERVYSQSMYQLQVGACGRKGAEFEIFTLQRGGLNGEACVGA